MGDDRATHRAYLPVPFGRRSAPLQLLHRGVRQADGDAADSVATMPTASIARAIADAKGRGSDGRASFDALKERFKQQVMNDVAHRGRHDV